MRTILFEDNNGRRLFITKAISKCLDVSLNEANKYTKSGGIILPENLCKDLVKLLDSYSIKYSICNEIKRIYTKPFEEPFEELKEETPIVESGICKVGSVYILTQEAFDEFTRYKKELETVINIFNNH